MSSFSTIESLLAFIESESGNTDKVKLSKAVQETFELKKEGSVYVHEDFAIRYSSSKTKSFGNTVLSLSKLKKYDQKPFLVCLVTPKENFVYLANTTFLKKISHSSKELALDNIRGSFNGSDIMRDFEGIENKPENFETLFASHIEFTFEENVVRLIAANETIKPSNTIFVPNKHELKNIQEAVQRTMAFMASPVYQSLNDQLQERVAHVRDGILHAKLIDNVNVRGRMIEYLITSEEEDISAHLLQKVKDQTSFPDLFTADGLGDYSFQTEDFNVEVDIKSKMFFLNSNPKGYNIDKLLRFLAEENSIYLVFVVGIDEYDRIWCQLCSIFHPQLLQATQVRHHWAGRGSRGVTQYMGEAFHQMKIKFNDNIDRLQSERFIIELLKLGE